MLLSLSLTSLLYDVEFHIWIWGLTYMNSVMFIDIGNNLQRYDAVKAM